MSTAASSLSAGRVLTLRLAVVVLLLTVAAHAQWEIEDSHTTASLRGIHNVGGGVAWASGTGGTVLRTLDDGKTWQTCPIPLAGTKDTPEKLDFRGIQAFDAHTAIVMSSGPGDQSRLYKTTDGCQTWKLLFTNPDKDGFWDAISFTRSASDQIHGWIFGDPVAGHFRVFETTNREETAFSFHDSPTLASGPKTAGAFAASNSAFFVLRNSPLLPFAAHSPSGRSKAKGSVVMEKRPFEYFVTGGVEGARVFIRQPDWLLASSDKKEWTSLPLPLGSGTEASGAFSIALRDYAAGVIVGGDYTKPSNSEGTAVYRDVEAQNWLPAQTPPHGYRSAVADEPSTKTWITVGPNGTDISTDDGRNWRPLTPTPQDAPDADKNWNALSLPFVVGPKGRIGKLRSTALPPATPIGSKPARSK